MRIRRAMSDETGGVLILFAVALPVLLLLSSFVLDTANWWVHKRHLQIQADAGALAAAQNFTFPTCNTDGSIAATAQQYAGISGSPVYNAQLGQAQKAALGDNDVAGTAPVPPTPTLPARGVHMMLNSPSFYDRPGTIIDTDLVGNPAPCTSKFVDVKMTETGVPWFFRAAGVRYIDAQARVGIQTAATLGGLMPVGVENVNPEKAHVWLFDEDNPTTVLAQAELAKNGVVSGGIPYWDNDVGHGSGPMAINVQAQRIGVKVALAGKASINLTGSYATVCAQTLVVCRPDPVGTTPNRGLTRIRGYSTAAGGNTAADVRLEDVRLEQPAGCAAPANGYFSTTCSNVTIRAKFAGPAISTTNATIRATIEGTNPNQVPALVWQSGTTWTASLPIAALGDGSRQIGITWTQTTGTVGTTTCRSGGQNTCTNTFNNVQSTFTSSRLTGGPLKALTVFTTALFSATEGPDDNNVPRCTGSTGCEQSIVVQIGVGGSLELGSPSDPPISLRVFGGSQNQSLKCDPTTSTHLRDDIAAGCVPEYMVNTGETCTTETALAATAAPWPCVAVRTGTQANDVARGLNTRVYGSESPPAGCPSNVANHWPTVPVGDRRRIPVFMVPFGSFDGSGSNVTVPVTGFAVFYVTGWTGNGGFNPPCRTLGDVLVPGTETDNAVMSGHFMSAALPGGTGNGETCDFTAIDACVAVLVK